MRNHRAGEQRTSQEAVSEDDEANDHDHVDDPTDKLGNLTTPYQRGATRDNTEQRNSKGHRPTD